MIAYSLNLPIVSFKPSQSIPVFSDNSLIEPALVKKELQKYDFGIIQSGNSLEVRIGLTIYFLRKF